MRVSVDPLVCEANGVCERLAPTVFHLDDEDELHILQPEPPEDLAEDVQRAVDGCPKLALTLTRD